ncbi:MAG: transcriptional repressor CopY [Myxococcaceae bacterium]|nr:transcriptional repressor CopY [Myxococcaceae bacterium]
MQLSSLTDLQLDVMTAVWDLGEATVSDVHQVLNSERRELALTTVATLLQRLAKQGWVTQRKEGRQLLYRAKVKQKEAAKGALQRLLSTFFGGRVSALTAQLLENRALTPDELEQLRKLLNEKDG